MDKLTIHKLQSRPNYLKDHNLKYFELEATLGNKLGKLSEIIESLPNGERKATGRQIINEINTYFNEILKDFNCLQEGSVARNLLEDLAGTIEQKENEVKFYMDLSKTLTKKLNDKR